MTVLVVILVVSSRLNPNLRGEPFTRASVASSGYLTPDNDSGGRVVAVEPTTNIFYCDGSPSSSSPGVEGFVLTTSASPMMEGFTSSGGSSLYTTNSSGHFVSIDPTTNTFYCDGSSSCVQPYTATSLKVGTWTLTDSSGKLMFTSSDSSVSTKPYLSTTSAGSVLSSTESGTIIRSLFLSNNVTSATYGALTWVKTTYTGNTSSGVIAYATYTPKSTSSVLFIDFDVRYTIAGTLSDTYTSFIAIDSSSSTMNMHTQLYNNGSGGGGRSGTLFPISTVVSNSTTSSRKIYILIDSSSGDDAVTLYTSYYTFTVLEQAT